MGEEINMEKEFSKYLDRMLAGEEVKVGADVDSDCRTALDFVQKMIQLRAVPSQSFKAQLKERLFRQLSEGATEVGEKRNWFWEGLRRLVPRRAAWRAAVTSAVVIVAVVGVVWYMGGFTPAPTPAPVPKQAPAPAPAPIPAPGLPPRLIELSASPTRTVYLPEEEVEINFTFTNVASEAAVVEPYPPRMRIFMPSLPGPYEEDIVRSFPPGAEELKLEPGESASYTFTWDQRDESGQQVTPGWYEVEVKHTVRKAAEPEGGYSITGTEARFLIQHPQGAMEKTIEVNQSQTATGLPFTWKREELAIDVTITLERVELTAEGARFRALVTSPSYTLSQGPLPPPQWMLAAYAQYTVDGITKDAGVAGMRPLKDGLQLQWGYDPAKLDPVPSDARKLTFTITKLGDWEGPWKFSISLEP